MKIKVEGNVFIESSEGNFIVREYSGTVNKKGVPNVSWSKYFITFGGCIRYALRQEIKASTAETLESLLAEFERIENKVTDIANARSFE